MSLYNCLFIFFNFIIGVNAYANGTSHNHQPEAQFDFNVFIVPLGISTLICLISTLILGFSMRKNRKILFPLHKKIAFITLMLGLVHGAMVLIFHS